MASSAFFSLPIPAKSPSSSSFPTSSSNFHNRFLQSFPAESRCPLPLASFSQKRLPYSASCHVRPIFSFGDGGSAGSGGGISGGGGGGGGGEDEDASRNRIDAILVLARVDIYFT